MKNEFRTARGIVSGLGTSLKLTPRKNICHSIQSTAGVKAHMSGAIAYSAIQLNLIFFFDVKLTPFATAVAHNP